MSTNFSSFLKHILHSLAVCDVGVGVNLSSPPSSRPPSSISVLSSYHHIIIIIISTTINISACHHHHHYPHHHQYQSISSSSPSPPPSISNKKPGEPIPPHGPNHWFQSVNIQARVQCVPVCQGAMKSGCQSLSLHQTKT